MKIFTNLVLASAVALSGLQVKASDSESCSNGGLISGTLCDVAELAGSAIGSPTAIVVLISLGSWLITKSINDSSKKEKLAAAQKEANEYLALNEEGKGESLSHFPKLNGVVEDLKNIAAKDSLMKKSEAFNEHQAIEVIASLQLNR